MTTMRYRVAEASAPLFVDAYATDCNNTWLFGSFWGHETILQEFMARLTIPNHDYGLTAFTLEPLPNSDSARCVLQVGKSKRLTRFSAKTPQATIVGSLCHTWIFDKTLKTPDYSQCEAFVLGTEADVEDTLLDRVWMQICQLSSVPILPHWRSVLLPLCLDNQWVTPLTGAGITGYRIRLVDDDLGEMISDGVRRQQLPIHP